MMRTDTLMSMPGGGCRSPCLLGDQWTDIPTLIGDQQQMDGVIQEATPGMQV